MNTKIISKKGNCLNKNIRQQLCNILNRKKSSYPKDKFSNFIIKGKYYCCIHYLFILLCSFILLFNKSVLHLTILLIIISLDALSIVILHGCPLTHLEKKYLGMSLLDERSAYLKGCNIMYSCQHEYEKQIELLINVWSLIAFKILIIISMNTI
jgi:hypothetical protein